jgi:hypothetical protein
MTKMSIRWIVTKQMGQPQQIDDPKFHKIQCYTHEYTWFTSMIYYYLVLFITLIGKQLNI